ncbi:MAG: FecR family protein [Opitutaceae bacterium]
MKILRIPILFVALFAISGISLSAAGLSTVKVLKVVGSVTKYNAKNAESPLKAGDILKQGDSISVDSLSSTNLVFSNGSTIDLKENTSITISEFTQASFGGNKSYEQLAADPSKSQALIELNYGELDGHVKSLQKGSKFDIETQLGTAAIRGTQFTVKLQFNQATGEFVLSVFNLDGTVDVYSRFVGSGESRPLDLGAQAVITVGNTDPNFNQILNFLLEFIPAADQPTDTTNITVFTPDTEDPGTQVVSPAGPDDPQSTDQQ